MRSKRNYVEIGIPIGSVLWFKDGGSEVKVIGEKKVEYARQACSLTVNTRKALELAEDHAVQLSPYWVFNSRTVKDINDEFHSSDDES
jgi:hypothetical protein